MRRFCFGILLFLFAAAVRADEAADRPYPGPSNQRPHRADLQDPVHARRQVHPHGLGGQDGSPLGRPHRRAPGRPPPAGRSGTQGELRAGALSPDGKTLAVGGLGYEVDGKHVAPIYLIDLAAGRIAARSRTSAVDFVSCLAFSPDGKRLASGGDKGAAFLWDVAAGKRLHTLEEPKDAVPPPDEKYPPQTSMTSLSLPNGKLLAAACRDKTAWIWSAETGRKVAGPLPHEDSVLCVAWKDDDTLAAGRGRRRRHPPLGPRPARTFATSTSFARRPANVESLTFVPDKNKEEFFYTWTRHPDRKERDVRERRRIPESRQPGRCRGTASPGAIARPRCAAPFPRTARLAATSGGGENRIEPLERQGRQAPPLPEWQGHDEPFHAFWSRRAGSWPGTTPRKSPPDAPEEIAHRAFDLGGLTFPSANRYQRFHGAVHVQGDNRLERAGRPHRRGESQNGICQDRNQSAVAVLHLAARTTARSRRAPAVIWGCTTPAPGS